MWYYRKSNAQQGPVDDERIPVLIANSEITRKTLVWTEGMAEWVPILNTELKEHFPPDQPPPIQPPPLPGAMQRQSVQPTLEDVKLLDTQFMVFWICLAAGIPLSLVIIGLFSIIAALVFFYLMLYRFWDLIQDGEARTTPGKGVGFCFIPFYNLYWNFIAVWGLAKDMNATPGSEVSR